MYVIWVIDVTNFVVHELHTLHDHLEKVNNTLIGIKLFKHSNN
jgi:hypothetical protein